MNKFVSLEKMSKKAKREYYLAQRGGWQINPVTRKPPNPKAYNRKKTRHPSNWESGPFLLCRKSILPILPVSLFRLPQLFRPKLCQGF